MNKLYLMKHPEVFQGKKHLSSGHSYFEGWYFKHTNGNESISFIPGIQISENCKKAFLQVITNTASYYVDYDISEFQFELNPFFVAVGNNTFSKDKIHIDVFDSSQNLQIYGDLTYSESKNIKTNFLKPNIMGPFSYIPKMECNHAILCMRNKIDGFIEINEQNIDFSNGIGYIEKDWGYSFPKSYIWCQGNNFFDSNASFMLSIADIPFSFLSFRGLICVLLIDNQEFKFTTYNNSKILKYSVEDSSFEIILKKGAYELKIQTENAPGHTLLAPVQGEMRKDILESITATITVTLKKHGQTIFQDTSINCGLEFVKE